MYNFFPQNVPSFMYANLNLKVLAFLVNLAPADFSPITASWPSITNLANEHLRAEGGIFRS